jgi:hypothetical protein
VALRAAQQAHRQPRDQGAYCRMTLRFVGWVSAA